MLNFKNREVILGSASPRRKELLRSLGIDFRIKKISAKEEVPDHIAVEDAACYLAEYKGELLMNRTKPGSLLITADTVVIHEGKIMGKPSNKKEAKEMVMSLSDAVHLVGTGVSVRDHTHHVSFSDFTRVSMTHISEEEADYYVDNYLVLDKAGAYGIQDWLGRTKIQEIVGSFYNVMGLPVHRLYEVLKSWPSL